MWLSTPCSVTPAFSPLPFTGLCPRPSFSSCLHGSLPGCQLESQRLSELAPQGGPHTSPQTGGSAQQELTVSRCWRHKSEGWGSAGPTTPSEAPREGSFLASSPFWWLLPPGWWQLHTGFHQHFTRPSLPGCVSQISLSFL